MSQYRRARFADEVAEGAGIRTLNQVWRGPENLPSGAEIDDPGAFGSTASASSASVVSLALFRCGVTVARSGFTNMCSVL